MRSWKPITDNQKDGTVLILGIPDKKIGPWMGYFWKNGNCWLSCEIPSYGHVPTHYDTLEGLLFE